MHRLHRRAGLVVPLVLVGLVAAGPWRVWRSTRRRCSWVTTCSPGWRCTRSASPQDGALPFRLRVAVPLQVGGAGVAVLLTAAGPSAVSMGDYAGMPLRNLSPPTLAMLALATAQLGLVLLLRDVGNRWMQRLEP